MTGLSPIYRSWFSKTMLQAKVLIPFLVCTASILPGSHKSHRATRTPSDSKATGSPSRVCSSTLAAATTPNPSPSSSALLNRRVTLVAVGSVKTMFTADVLAHKQAGTLAS